ARPQVVDGDAADAVVGPDGHGRPGRRGPVGQDGVVVFGEEVGPVLGPGPFGVGHGQAVAGGAEVGVEVEAAVGADAGVGGGVEPLLDRCQAAVPGGGGEVGDPHVVAGGGAEVLGQEEPAAVVGHVDGVVGGGIPAVAEDQVVGGGVGAEAVEADPAVEGLLAGRHRLGGEAPDVVEAVPGGRPPERAVAAAVDRAVDVGAGADVHHPQHRLLGAGVGQEVGQEAAVGGRGPAVEGDRVVVRQGAGVDQHPPAGQGILARG